MLPFSKYIYTLFAQMIMDGQALMKYQLPKTEQDLILTRYGW
jgi:hypothetical protein